MGHHRRYRGGTGEVSGEGLVRDPFHAVARVGLHRRPHVAIYGRGIGKVVGIPGPGPGLCLHAPVHAGLPGGDGLSAVGVGQQGRLVGGAGAEVVLLCDSRRRLKVGPLAAQLQVSAAICGAGRTGG